MGDAETVLNVGAGAGAYEPPNRTVVAVEPSAVMLDQRPAKSAAAVQASAESLPSADASFDAVMAVLSDHHWRDRRQGLRELRRVARRRVVLFNADPAVFSALNADDVRRAVHELDADVRSGAWDERHVHLRNRSELHLGYYLGAPSSG